MSRSGQVGSALLQSYVHTVSLSATMKKLEALRVIIVSGLHAGRTAKEIIQFNNVKKTTVYKLKKDFDQFVAAGGRPEDFDVQRKVQDKRCDDLGPEFDPRLQEVIDEDPGRPMRSLATQFGVSKRTINRKVTEEIRYKSYAFRKGQFMNQATKNRRFKKAKLMLNALKNPKTPGQLVFFSDEKNFSQDQKVNKKKQQVAVS